MKKQATLILKSCSAELRLPITKELNAELLKTSKELITIQCTRLLDMFNSNNIFNIICRDIYQTYIDRPNVNNAKKCFQNNTVYGVLSAYKLFYVGCSRSKRNLTILVDKGKISSFEDEFVRKAKKVGFKII
jgi:DNA helicase-2/ATP-dependent DNA helicase PcrA